MTPSWSRNSTWRTSAGYDETNLLQFPVGHPSCQAVVIPVHNSWNGIKNISLHFFYDHATYMSINSGRTRGWWWQWVGSIHLYIGTCIKRPLSHMVSQVRWSLMTGRLNMIFVKTESEIRNLSAAGKTLPVSLDRFQYSIYDDWNRFLSTCFVSWTICYVQKMWVCEKHFGNCNFSFFGN